MQAEEQVSMLAEFWA